MGEPFRERLMAILTPEQRAELPGGVKIETPAAPKAAPKSKGDGVSSSATKVSGNVHPASESQMESDNQQGATARPVQPRRDQRGAPPVESAGKPN